MTEMTTDLEISEDLSEHKQWPELMWRIRNRTVVKYWAADWKKEYHIDCWFNLNKNQKLLSVLYFRREKGEKIYRVGKSEKGKKGKQKEETRKEQQTTKAVAELTGAVELVRSKRKPEQPHEEWGGKVSTVSRLGQSKISEGVTVFQSSSGLRLAWVLDSRVTNDYRSIFYCLSGMHAFLLLWWPPRNSLQHLMSALSLPLTLTLYFILCTSDRWIFLKYHHMHGIPQFKNVPWLSCL